MALASGRGAAAPAPRGRSAAASPIPVLHDLHHARSPLQGFTPLRIVRVFRELIAAPQRPFLDFNLSRVCHGGLVYQGARDARASLGLPMASCPCRNIRQRCAMAGKAHVRYPRPSRRRPRPGHSPGSRARRSAPGGIPGGRSALRAGLEPSLKACRRLCRRGIER